MKHSAYSRGFLLSLNEIGLFNESSVRISAVKILEATCFSFVLFLFVCQGTGSLMVCVVLASF